MTLMSARNVVARASTRAVSVGCRPHHRSGSELHGRTDGCSTSSASPIARLHNSRAKRTVASGLSHRHVHFFGNSDPEPYVEYSVVKVSIGMFGDIPKMQKLLNRVAETDTSDELGLHNLLRDTTLVLLDKLQYSGYAQIRNKGCEDIDEAETFFGRASMEERGKFREETLVNYDGITRSKDAAGKGDMLDTWMCITLLLAIEGEIKFPKINSVYELKQTLEALRSLHPDDLVAFELLWTPQAEGDSYNRDQLLADYPTLMTLS